MKVGEKAMTPELHQQLLKAYGLDKPWYVQYAVYLSNLSPLHFSAYGAPPVKGDTATTRTLPMTGAEDLQAAITYMQDYAAQTGRADLPEVVLGGLNSPGEVLSTQQLLDRISTYQAMGVTTAAISAKGRTAAEWCDNAEMLGAQVIAKIDP